METRSSKFQIIPNADDARMLLVSAVNQRKARENIHFRSMQTAVDIEPRTANLRLTGKAVSKLLFDLNSLQSRLCTLTKCTQDRRVIFLRTKMSRDFCFFPCLPLSFPLFFSRSAGGFGTSSCSRQANTVMAVGVVVVRRTWVTNERKYRSVERFIADRTKARGCNKVRGENMM